MTVLHTLQSVCTAIVDCEHKTAPIDQTGDFFAVGTPAMRGNVINYEASRRINKATFVAWTRRIQPQFGDLLFAREAPVGPIVRIPFAENVAAGQRTVLLRPNPDLVDTDFLFYLLASPLQQERIASKAAGSTVAHLNVADVRSFELPALPLLTEQRAIADVLGALDDKIAANVRAISTAHMLGSARYQRLAHEPTQLVRVGDVMSLEYGKSLPAGARQPGPIPVFGSGGVVGAHSESLVSGPGVVVGRKGTAGAVHWSNGPFFPIDTTFYVSVHSTELPLTFCYFALKSLGLDGNSSDSAVPGLNRNAAYAALLRLPEEVNLSKFDAEASAMFDLTAGLERESARLAKTRDALLPGLMSGRIRVKDAERVVGEAV